MTLRALPDEADGLRVLAATGELDAAVVPALLPRAASLVAGARAVALDLSGATFLDSGGVRLVDHLARACAAGGAPFRVVAPRGTRPRRVLELVGMADALAVDDLGTAVTALRAAG
ncbi:STAS domain-containing protein [Kineococcus esterisolvens]|uniref:STAS domain-containing protein n=1 Tax=unclassified Kineococcus TaxID=2621656 RepID=UPI003D7CA611